MYINPYETTENQNGEWLKANFHVHASANSNEKHYGVSEVISMYKEAGYDVISIANQKSFVDTQEFGQKYDILTINGIEYIEKDGILCIGIKKFIQGDPQEAIDECVRQGGFSVLCHPNWINEDLSSVLSKDIMRKLQGYLGIEILTMAIFNRFKGSGLATDLWDEFLSEGKLVWGFANDDFHKYFDMDRGWNVIYSRGRNYADLKTAVTRGSLYASTGLELKHFSFENGTIRIAANFKDNHAKKIHYEFIGDNGEMLHECSGVSGEYCIKGNESYVRVQAASEHGAMLWTQPLYDNDKLKQII